MDSLTPRKFVAALAGVLLLVFAGVLLFAPVSSGGQDCGSVLSPKSSVVPAGLLLAPDCSTPRNTRMYEGIAAGVAGAAVLLSVSGVVGRRPVT